MILYFFIVNYTKSSQLNVLMFKTLPEAFLLILNRTCIVAYEKQIGLSETCFGEIVQNITGQDE